MSNFLGSVQFRLVNPIQHHTHHFKQLLMLNYKIANLTRILLLALAAIAILGALIAAGFAIFGDFGYGERTEMRIHYYTQAFYALAVGCILNVLAMATAFLM